MSLSSIVAGGDWNPPPSRVSAAVDVDARRFWRAVMNLAAPAPSVIPGDAISHRRE